MNITIDLIGRAWIALALLLTLVFFLGLAKQRK